MRMSFYHDNPRKIKITSLEETKRKKCSEASDLRSSDVEGWMGGRVQRKQNWYQRGSHSF